MIALWMLGATLIALLVGAASVAAERVLRLWRRPARDVWTVAIVATVALPVAAAVAPRVAPRPTTVGTRFTNTVYQLPAMVVGAAESRRGAGLLARLVRFDRPLAFAWGALSLGVALLVLRGARRLHRQRSAWPIRRVDGVRVLVTDDVGPAVVGVRDPEIVLPRWALALEDPLRALVVRHESEHVRVGDPRRLALGALAVAAMPWNAVLWWQLRRLRTALEIDCDARVLARDGDVSRYGLLLLAVAQRRSAALGHLAGAPALAESTSDLSRRITAMRSPRPRRRALRAALGTVAATAAVGATFVACSETRDAVSPERAARMKADTSTVLRLPAVRASTTSWADSLRVAMDGARTQNDSFRVAVAAFNRTLAQPRVTPELYRSLEGALVQLRTAQDGRARPLTRPVGGAPEIVDGAYFDYQVEKAVRPAPASRAPRYPDILKSAKVEGTVFAQFVVDETGRPNMATFRVLKSDHALFTNSVRAALADMTFLPAEVGGKKVKQLVQQPFQFALTP